MMRGTIICVGLAVAAATLIGSAAQQDEMPRTPKRFENVRWYEIVHIDFKPQYTEEAIQLVHDHFAKAGKAAGFEGVRLFEYATGGEWDLTMLFPMEGGPSDMEWEVSPDNLKWMDALARQEGSFEAAKELIDKYHTMVQRHRSQIIREHIDSNAKPDQPTRERPMRDRERDPGRDRSRR